VVLYGEGGMTNQVALCEASEIAEGEMKAFSIEGGARIAVYHVDGGWFATDDLCSHAVASLTEGWLEGHTVICPAHSGEFDIRSGEALCFPASRPIRTYRVWVDGGRLFADISSAGTASPVPPHRQLEEGNPND
jgi:nitrite reductase/ring-hydroxylating ferredoxin subunit